MLIYNTIPTTNGAAANVVIGQASFTSNGASAAASGLSHAEALALAPDGRLLVADRSNSRVLIYASVPTSNRASATTVIGQTALGINSSGTSATTMSSPWGIAVSSPGQLAVSDFSNKRVLVYDSVPTSNGAAAKAVLGQPNFNSSAAFPGGISAHSMTDAPFQLSFTTYGRLLVGGIDLTIRVMIFSPATPPAAIAGSTVSVNEGANVILNGTASHNTNSPAQPLTYLSGGRLEGRGIRRRLEIVQDLTAAMNSDAGRNALETAAAALAKRLP